VRNNPASETSKNEQTSPQDDRAEWERPVLRRLAANAARVNPTANINPGDGMPQPDKS
jgi:hypothetical protein